jgi:hypothetical protein
MWKQWMNLILGLAVVVMAYYGAAMGWMLGAGALIALVALWAALEESPSRGRSMAHAH